MKRELLTMMLAASLLVPACGASRVDTNEAAELGYVNAGPDDRAGGALGRLLGSIQRDLSFKDPRPPKRVVERIGNVWVETATAPNGRQHTSIAVPIESGRWATIRAGWRYDANWGDANVVGYNPNPEIVGGYIADVVIKLDAREPFIEGATR